MFPRIACLVLCWMLLAPAWANPGIPSAGDAATQPQHAVHPSHKMEDPSYTHTHAQQKQHGEAPPVAPAVSPSVSAPASSAFQRQGRFLFPGLSSALTGNPSLSSVLTLNLNNLALVGLFLIGVFVLLPSIIGFLTGLTGGAPYAAAAAKSLRMDDQPNASSMWTIMQSLDSVLSKNNIDVRVCLERAACHVAKRTFTGTRTGHPSTLESILNYAIGSNYGQTLLASYRLKEAADRGRSGQDCDSHYNRCPYSLANLSKLLSTFSPIPTYTPSSPPSPSPPTPTSN